MTLREAQALILLYQSCRDETLRRKVRELVPDLGDFDSLKNTPIFSFNEPVMEDSKFGWRPR